MKDVGSRLPNIGRILKTILIVAAIFFIVIFTLVWFGIIAAATFSAPFLTNFFPGKESLTIIMMINLLFVIGIPLVGIIISIIRLVWKRRMGRGWKATLAILWLVNGVSFIAIVGTLGQEFVTQDEVQQLLPIDNSSDTYTLSYYTPQGYERELEYFGGKGIEMPGVPVRYAIKKSNDQTWRLNQIVSSRGKRAAEARDLAWEIEIPLKIEEGNIASPDEIPFAELSKWRDQEAVLELSMPVGKFIRFDRDIWRSAADISVDVRSRESQLYMMSESGELICQDCASENESTTTNNTTSTESLSSSVLEQESNIEAFDKIHLSGPMKVTVEYGEVYKLKVIGNEQDLALVENNQESGQLNIGLTAEQTASPVRVYITAPSLVELNLESTDDVLLRGFTLDNLNIQAEGEFELKANIDIQTMSLSVNDGVEVEFTGNAQLIEAELSNACRLDTDRGTVKDIKLKLENESKVKLGPSVNVIEKTIDEASSLRIVD